jgi:tetratricopeptide (TPR) repeat protein
MSESCTDLRATLTGLIGFAAIEEQILLVEAGEANDSGDPSSWAAVPTIAHTSEFRDEQVQRLAAIRDGVEPPEFARIEHESPDVYRRYCKNDADTVWQLSRHTSEALIDGTRLCSDADLLDPARHPWLQGRHLWLQIVVRGFWHPLGHLGDYYLHHGMQARALSLHQHACTTAHYLGAPPAAAGMAYYNLACAQAAIGEDDDAVSSLERAIRLNPDLRGHAQAEPDLAGLREAGRLARR